MQQICWRVMRKWTCWHQCRMKTLRLHVLSVLWWFWSKQSWMWGQFKLVGHCTAVPTRTNTPPWSLGILEVLRSARKWGNGVTQDPKTKRDSLCAGVLYFPMLCWKGDSSKVRSVVYKLQPVHKNVLKWIIRASVVIIIMFLQDKKTKFI